jgi:hypothetical protein
MRCLSCKYDLSNLAEHRCPECGRAFDPNNPYTFESPADKFAIHPLRAVAIIGGSLLILLVLRELKPTDFVRAALVFVVLITSLLLVVWYFNRRR